MNTGQYGGRIKVLAEHQIRSGTLVDSTVNLFIKSYLAFYSPAFVPVVEFVDVLNVSKNNVVLVDETRRDVL